MGRSGGRIFTLRGPRCITMIRYIVFDQRLGVVRVSLTCSAGKHGSSVRVTMKIGTAQSPIVVAIEDRITNQKIQ